MDILRGMKVTSMVLAVILLAGCESRMAKENARREKEQERVLEELARLQKENAAHKAELDRLVAESDRISAVSDRLSAEAADLRAGCLVHLQAYEQLGPAQKKSFDARLARIRAKKAAQKTP